jgi:alginate O-acetyltransferase complex protein AlgJ
MPSLKPPDTQAPGRRAGEDFRASIAAMALFLAWLFLPLVSLWFHHAGPDPAGIREAVQPPKMGGRPLVDFLRDFSRAYEKSAPIRSLLVPKYMAFKLHVLGLSQVSAVIVGRDHWLFVGQENDKIDERRYFLGTNLFNEETLGLWLRVFNERHQWLERRGIAYQLVFAPNKSSIYPEYMPAGYPRGRTTRLDQLVGFIGLDAPGFPLIDLRPAMLAGKKGQLLYWPTDSHWNDFGMHLAYREIIRGLSGRFPSLQALPEDSFEIRPVPPSLRDLEKLLQLPWEGPPANFSLVPKQPLPAIPLTSETSASAAPVASYRSDSAHLPLALIIHDSFGDTLKPLLSCHFRVSRWILDRNHVFPADWIEKNRPGLVIEEIVERYLEEEPWVNPAEIRK